ncbi:MAG: quinone-dependent dihydroorotate dehydrogenase [Desulfobacterales bacterium]|nr:MAG: quinone-dependent dihydroorotate dehydrogenase [Desulfobacterales bacterium]
MNTYSKLIRPLLFQLDAEQVHHRAIQLGQLAGSIKPIRAIFSSLYSFSDPRLQTEVCGIRFSNPLGLAPGWDKNGRAINVLSAMGFGHVEVGSISRGPSLGNPKPRLFRLPLDQALVVYYGLPNDGSDAIAARLKRLQLSIPLGINIAKTNRGVAAPPESDDEVIDDYVYSARRLKDVGDYICLNLSCPNTRNGREFFEDRQRIGHLLQALSELNIRCPVFLKISPRGGIRRIEEILQAVEGVSWVSGFVFNAPPGKPNCLLTPRRFVEAMPGAVTGKPVERHINEYIYMMYGLMDRNRYRIIGSGGVFTAEDAYRKICLGSSLVQLVTGMVFEGPSIAKKINQGLLSLLERDGFANLSEAVGTGSDL